MDQYIVHCRWDPDARVWVATSDGGPATGADTIDELIEKLKG
jgi:Domain of unknown function (DUF1902)